MVSINRFDAMKNDLYFRRQIWWSIFIRFIIWGWFMLYVLLHRFTISVPVLIWPIFWQLLLRNGKIWSKSLFWNEQTQGADSRWEQQSYFTSTSSNFSIIYFQIDIVFQLKYYQSPNHYYFYYLAIKRRNFL